MKKLFLFIMIILISFSLYSRDKLKLMITDEELSKLEYSDFDLELEENETIDVSSNNVVVCIQFITIDPEEYTIYLNDTQIEDFYDDCYIDFERAAAFFALRDILHAGLNELSVYSLSEKRQKKWTLNIPEMEHVVDYSIHKQITYGRGWKRGFTVSPDGNLIAFVVTDNDYNAIMVYNITDKQTRTIIENETEVKWGNFAVDDESNYSFAPCWSRDGAYLFYVSNNTGHFELYRAEIDSNGDRLNQSQLTQYNSYLCNLTYSNLDDVIYFVSNKSGKMAIYSGVNAESAKDTLEFQTDIVRITPEDNGSYFSPAISYDDKVMAYCKRQSEEDVSIILYDLINKKVTNEISDNSFDCVFPSWSPSSDLVSFYQGDRLYLYDTNSDEQLKIASNVRRPEYPVSPCWGPAGNALYYISTDTNNSIRKISLDLENFSKKKEETLLNDKYYANNYEVGITPDRNTLIRACFQKNHEIWLYESENKGPKEYSIMGFKSNYNSLVSVWDKSKKSFLPVALYPKISNNNAFIEMENLSTGAYRFKVAEKEFNQRLFNTNELIDYSPGVDRAYSVKHGLLSTFLPSSGQYFSKNYEKNKFFFYSFWGMAALTAGSYYYSDYLYDDYEKQTEMKGLVEARDQYDMMSSLTTGLLIGTISNYLLNVYDGVTSTVNKQNEYRELHAKNFHDVTSNLPIERDIYGKILGKTGELKILTEKPNLKVSLIDEKGNETYYGKTSLVFDNKTYFTIADLEEGNYTLITEDNFGNKSDESISIDKNEVKYKCLRSDKRNNTKFTSYLKKAVPGYTQFKRDEDIKAYSIISLTATSLLGAAYCQIASEVKYSNYKESTDVAECLENRSSYIRNGNLRNTFLLSFSLSYLYGYIDSCLEGK